MKKIVFIFMILSVISVFAVDSGNSKEINNFNILYEIEKLDSMEDFEGAYDLAKKNVSRMNYKVKAEVYAKMSWYVLEITDAKKRAGKVDKKELMAGYELGQSFAKRALENGNTKGYFWLAANMGRWNEAKGMLNALNNIIAMKTYMDKCIELNPEYDEVWNLYAHIYSGLYIFGGLSSKDKKSGQVLKGNRNHAIACHRKVLDVTERKEYIPYLYDFGVQLEKRNWSVDEREKYVEKARLYYDKSESLPEKMKYYEGAVDFSKPYFWTDGKILGSLTDREEAYEIYKYCCDILRKKEKLKDSERRIFHSVLKSLESFE